MNKPIPANWTIQIGRSIWTQMWQLMMSKLAPPNDVGEYQRPVSQFHDRVSNQAGATYLAAANRYLLYVGWSCPWAHRTLVVRSLKGLAGAIDVVVVDGDVNSGGWVLPVPTENCQTLADVYRLSDTNYRGRSTVPALWDCQTKSIVNNESGEIIEILNSEFNEFATNPDIDLYPVDLKSAIDDWNNKIYHHVNNGVYRCGFAQSQTAFDRAYRELFDCLTDIDRVLGDGVYLCGDRLTLADVRLFTTLIRFDLVYHHLFKCNYRRIQDYPHLSRYLISIYQIDGIAATCNLPIVLRDYYTNLFPLNPGGIVPQLPDLSYLVSSYSNR
jgi:glutathionyl-hydroquinone reductase